jgi:hypothetical protein
MPARSTAPVRLGVSPGARRPPADGRRRSRRHAAAHRTPPPSPATFLARPSAGRPAPASAPARPARSPLGRSRCRHPPRSAPAPVRTPPGAASPHPPRRSEAKVCRARSAPAPRPLRRAAHGRAGSRARDRAGAGWPRRRRAPPASATCAVTLRRAAPGRRTNGRPARTGASGRSSAVRRRPAAPGAGRRCRRSWGRPPSTLRPPTDAAPPQRCRSW